MESGAHVGSTSRPAAANAKGALLRGLRLRGNEAQFTKAISAVAQADAGFASAFVQLVLDVARRDARHIANVTRMGTAPPELECQSEHGVYDEYDLGLGRVDLRFDGGEDFTLFVENKLYSGFGHEQLERYQAALRSLPEGRERSGLIAITRDVPSSGELDAGADRWLGAIRWARLYETGLATLPIREPELALQWQSLLTIMHEDGDLGMTRVDSELIIAWTRFDEAREHLVAILGDVRGRALEALRDLLHAKYRGQGPRESLAGQHYLGQAEAQPYNKRAMEAVWTGFRVPARVNHPAIRLNFWVADAGKPVFSVEARHWRADARLDEGERRLRTAARKLAKSEFQAGHSGGDYVFWSEHAPKEYLKAPDVPARLIELIEADLERIVASGVLAGEFDAALVRGRKAPPKVARR